MPAGTLHHVDTTCDSTFVLREVDELGCLICCSYASIVDPSMVPQSASSWMMHEGMELTMLSRNFYRLSNVYNICVN